MIELTPAAADKLRELRGADPARAYLRLWVAGRSCCRFQYSLAFDEKVETDDAVVESAGIPVAIDPESGPYCDGARIDYLDESSGPGGFIVTNDRQGGGCSCGH
ncbi:MAG TPA: iron-sulfur cluster assembly accessory protein [Candidatus Limnocylindrales bacterium]|nr:iron-sulfur cluster assembly accessory protein [Candidatus Limnocylindrales bacterium]